MKPNAETIAKLRELEKYILKDPRRFNMNFWGTAVLPENIDNLRKQGYPEEVALKKQHPACETVGCLAGNTCVMVGLIKPKNSLKGDIKFYEFPVSTPDKAQKWLGIPDEDASKLFYLPEWGYKTGWPQEFSQKLRMATEGTCEYAKITVARLEHYIETGE